MVTTCRCCLANREQAGFVVSASLLEMVSIYPVLTTELLETYHPTVTPVLQTEKNGKYLILRIKTRSSLSFLNYFDKFIIISKFACVLR